MTPRAPETHEARFVDLPLVRRLIEDGVVLDTELVCTREVSGGTASLILSRLLPQRSVYTLVGRAGEQRAVGQYKLRAEGGSAYLVFVAPAPIEDVRDPAMLHLLDAVTADAGRRGAYRVIAEVDEDSPLFETMRHASFSVYARQEVWRWTGVNPAIAYESTPTPGVLQEARDDELNEIAALYGRVVPSLIHPVAAPPDEATGWVYRRDGRLRAHIACSGGKSGLYLMPLVDREVGNAEVRAILAGVLVKARQIARAPITLCLRRYQDGLDPALRAVGFEPIKQQAVMVRQIAAGIRHPEFARTVQGLAALPQTVRPPRSNAHLVPLEEARQLVWNDGSQTISMN